MKCRERDDTERRKYIVNPIQREKEWEINAE